MIISDLSQKSKKTPRPCGGHSQEFNDSIQILDTRYSTGPSKKDLALSSYSRDHWFNSHIE